MTLGEALKIYRNENNLSQREFARMIGSSQAQISAIENLQYIREHDKTAIKIKEAINYQENEVCVTADDRISDEIKTLCTHLRAARLYKRMTLEKVINAISDKVEVPCSTLSKIDNGVLSISSEYNMNIVKVLLELFEDDLIYTEDFKDALKSMKNKLNGCHIYEADKFNKEFNMYDVNYQQALTMHLSKYNLTNDEFAKKYLGSQGEVIRWLITGKSNIFSSKSGFEIAEIIGFRGITNSKEVKKYIIQNLESLVDIFRAYMNKNNMMQISVAYTLNISVSLLGKVLCKKIYLSNNIINVFVILIKEWIADFKTNNEFIKIMMNLKFVLYDTIPVIYKLLEGKEIEYTEEVKNDEPLSVERPITNMEVDTMVELNKIEKEDNNDLMKERLVMFKNMSKEEADSVKITLVDAIISYLNHNEIELAEGHLQFIENLNMFDTSILRLKLKRVKEDLEKYGHCYN